MSDAPAKIGDNVRPLYISEVITAEAIRKDIGERHADLVKRQSELLHGDGGKTKGLEGAPTEVTDDTTAQRVGDFVAQLTAFEKNCDAQREKEKAPYLQAGRTVDAFFKDLAKAITEGKAKLLGVQGIYLRRKAAEERARVEAEAKRLREEAERKAADAKTDADLEEAVGYEQASLDRQDQANAKPAELARTRSTSAIGSLSTLRTTWHYEVEDITKVPEQYKMVNDKAVNAYIREQTKGSGTPAPIPGLKIFSRQDAVVS